MGCGCRGYKNIDERADEEKTVRTIAKNQAKKDGVYYVLVKCRNGNFDFMREKDFSHESGVAIVEYLSPV